MICSAKVNYYQARERTISNTLKRTFIFVKDSHLFNCNSTRWTDNEVAGIHTTRTTAQTIRSLLTTVTTKSAVQNNNDNPAVVILFGWTGATMKHLSRYADIYSDNGCTTICRVASVPQLMLRDKEALRSVAIDAIKEANSVVRSAEKEGTSESKTPVIIQVFSNGGCFILEEVMAMIADESSLDPGLNEEVELIKSRLRLGALVFDSGPAYPSLFTGFLAIHHSIPDIFLRTKIQTALFAAIVYDVLFHLVTSQPPSATQFWERMTYGTDELKCEHIYIYSESDQVTDHLKLKELIKKKKERDLVSVTSMKLLNSPHVRHLTTHKKEYLSMVHQIIARALKRSAS